MFSRIFKLVVTSVLSVAAACGSAAESAAELNYPLHFTMADIDGSG